VPVCWYCPIPYLTFCLLLSRWWRQVLWVADNYIGSIAGLSALVSLVELNLARNDIVLVGHSLQHNSHLTGLNLADNKICSLEVST